MRLPMRQILAALKQHGPVAHRALNNIPETVI